MEFGTRDISYSLKQDNDMSNFQTEQDIVVIVHLYMCTYFWSVLLLIYKIHSNREMYVRNTQGMKTVCQDTRLDVHLN